MHMYLTQISDRKICLCILASAWKHYKSIRWYLVFNLWPNIHKKVSQIFIIPCITSPLLSKSFSYGEKICLSQEIKNSNFDQYFLFVWLISWTNHGCSGFGGPEQRQFQTKVDAQELKTVCRGRHTSELLLEQIKIVSLSSNVYESLKTTIEARPLHWVHLLLMNYHYFSMDWAHHWAIRNSYSYRVSLPLW